MAIDSDFATASAVIVDENAEVVEAGLSHEDAACLSGKRLHFGKVLKLVTVAPS